MRQWRDVKRQHRDALVFFRVGDFYELFNEDAREGARLLGLTLTSRNNGAAARVPLAGIPVRALDEYLPRLVAAGRRVAICEQMEDPAEAKGIVRREVIETVTPGTVLDDPLLHARRNTFLVAVSPARAGQRGVAAIDLSTGEFVVQAVAVEALADELGRLEPSELLLSRGEEGTAPLESALTTLAPGVVRTWRDEWLFDAEQGHEELEARYRVHTLEGFGLQRSDDRLLAAAGALSAYLREVRPAGAEHLRPPTVLRGGAAMALDEMTRRNLELVEPLRGGEAGATLLGVLDEAVTAMGARLLRRWVLRPLLDPRAIWDRQAAITELVGDPARRRTLRDALAPIADLERLAGKLGTGRASPRDLAGLGGSLRALPAVRAATEAADADLLARVGGELDLLDDVAELLERALADRVPVTLQEGGVIREGYDAELDDLRATRAGAVDFIARLQAQERESTGIGSLKVGYNKVFGYYLEVTRANFDRVPERYVRKQTLANAERYFTPELKGWEQKVLGAEERIVTLEAELFAALRRRVADEVVRLQASAEGVATLDVLAALAEVATVREYARPEVHTGYALEIVGGRHPVVETTMPRDQFIPNDLSLGEDGFLVILTGPNMAGKSTVLRQVGLIQLLAQMGSWVPADRARIPMVDRVFTRVGASDNLVRGQSTFMVEMHETAAILHGATDRSLVLLDEIGRGTSTYDGVSIAWSVTEHLHEAVGCKAIFATHYHELTQLGDLLPGVLNLNVSVREVGDDIVFLRRLEAGGADRSYGIQVARLAGVPDSVLARARELLAELEGTHSGGGEGLGRHGAHRPASGPPPDQLSFFQPTPDPPAITALRTLDVNRITPIEALRLLDELVRSVREGDGR